MEMRLAPLKVGKVASDTRNPVVSMSSSDGSDGDRGRFVERLNAPSGDDRRRGGGGRGERKGTKAEF